LNLLLKLKVVFTPEERRTSFFILLGIFLLGGFEVIGIASIAPFMAVVTTPDLIHENSYLQLLYGFFGSSSDKDFIITLGVCVISLILISNSYQAFMLWWFTYFSQMQVHRLSARLLRQYLLQPYSFFLNRNSSDLSKNILNEVSHAISGVVFQGFQVLSKTIVTIAIFIFLLQVNPWVAVITALVLVPAFVLVYKVVKKRIEFIAREREPALSQVYKMTNQVFSGIKDVKLLGVEKTFINNFEVSSENLAHFAAQKSLMAGIPRFFLEVLAFGGMIFVVINLVSTVGAADVIPIVSIYAMAGYKLMPALNQLYTGVMAIKYSFPAFESLIADLSVPNETGFEAEKKDLHFKEWIQFKDVSFAYPSADFEVLSNLNMTIRKNTTMGLVGATGAGKTTLVDILLGLLSPVSGSVVVDSIELNSQVLRNWQQRLGYVPQSIFLTDDSIENNIAFGIPKGEIVIEQVKFAAQMANVDGFIDTLPEKYSTLVGEWGVRLSGGQRQRIGIARALYHNPDVLVFDEATSALDGVTESVVMDALHNLSHKKTIIIIAHRLSTVKECDEIILLDNGRISDRGTYQELINSSELFRGMANINFKGSPDPKNT